MELTVVHPHILQLAADINMATHKGGCSLVGALAPDRVRRFSKKVPGAAKSCLPPLRLYLFGVRDGCFSESSVAALE